MTRRPTKTSKKPEALQTPSANVRPRKGLIVSVVIALIAGGIPFAVGRYIEMNSPDPFDSSAYVYSARHLLDGARLGVDEVTSAFPGTLLVNVLGVKLFGFNDVGPKVVQAILQAAALVFMFCTLYRFFGSAPAVVSTTVAAIYLSAPLIAKGGNVKEQFMIAFMLSAACCFLYSEFTGKRWWLVLCGVLAIQPYYFKPTGISIVIVLGGYLLASRVLSRNIKALLIEIALFLCGMAVGLLVPASLFIWQQQMSRFLRTFPVVAAKTVIVLFAAAAAIYGLAVLWRRFELGRQLKSVHRRIYIAGAIALVAALIAGMAIVTAANRHYTQKYNHPTASVGQDLVAYAWDIPVLSWPPKLWSTAVTQVHRLYGSTGLKGGYVEYSWKQIKFADVAAKIWRYYKALSVPILLALLSLVTAVFVTLRSIFKKQPLSIHGRLVWLLAAWWILDMTFVWVSPHSYEQYYLPLCASAAMLSAYAVWKWQQQWKAASFKLPWLAAGAVSLLIVASLSIPIFIGQRYSPDTGADYTAGGGVRRRGFADALERATLKYKSPWQQAGEFIRARSSAQDTIYVWGWFPGIYVAAERMAPVAKAYEADMHFMPPEHLRGQAELLVRGFTANPPKFIVDSRKRHFPFNRQPLELWPIVPPKFLGNDRPRLLNPADQQELSAFGIKYKNDLRAKNLPDEAQRYDAMQPLRDYVMNNYRPAGKYGEHMVFERKSQ